MESEWPIFCTAIAEAFPWSYDCKASSWNLHTGSQKFQLPSTNGVCSSLTISPEMDAIGSFGHIAFLVVLQWLFCFDLFPIHFSQIGKILYLLDTHCRCPGVDKAMYVLRNVSAAVLLQRKMWVLTNCVCVCDSTTPLFISTDSLFQTDRKVSLWATVIAISCSFLQTIIFFCCCIDLWHWKHHLPYTPELFFF